jgi:hypothetical protein
MSNMNMTVRRPMRFIAANFFCWNWSITASRAAKTAIARMKLTKLRPNSFFDPSQSKKQPAHGQVPLILQRLVNRDFTVDRSTPQTSPSKRNLRSTARENAQRRPKGDGFLTRLLLGLGFLGCDRRPGGLPRQPLGLEPLPVGRKCLLCNLVLSHCLSGINLAKCLTRSALRLSGWLGWFKFARCLCHFFAFSPSSTKRRRERSRSRNGRRRRRCLMAWIRSCNLIAISPSP